MLHATGWSKETVNCNMSLTYWTPFLFPKNYESLILDIQLREVKAKIPLKGTSKVNIQTDTQIDTQTHTHMDKLTYRKHQPRGPILWKGWQQPITALELSLHNNQTVLMLCIIKFVKTVWVWFNKCHLVSFPLWYITLYKYTHAFFDPPEK